MTISSLLPCEEGCLNAEKGSDFNQLDKALLYADAVVCDHDRDYWESFFVAFPMYASYAALFGFQHVVKVLINIGDDMVTASREFTFSVSCLYVFNMIFRIAHGAIFGHVNSRGRVFIAMALMSVSMLMLATLCVTSKPFGIRWVAAAYSLGGVAIGTFEPNFLSCLTPYGPGTKQIAITGIPVGISALLIGGFFLLGPPVYAPPMVIYVGIAALVLGGMAVLHTRIPPKSSGGALDVGEEVVGLRKLREDARKFRHWLPQIWSHTLLFLVDMFMMPLFAPGVYLYIYDKPTVHLRPGVTVPTDSFFAVFNIITMLGSLLGRIASYRIQEAHPIRFLPLSMAGVFLVFLKQPLLVPLSGFLIMVADGLIYGGIIRHIDASVPSKYNLVAISYWCLMGDIGGVLGTNAITFMRDAIGTD